MILVKCPILFQESEESLEITPTGSTSNISDTDSDTDSEIDVTPRREALITPPTGFALSPYPRDEDGHLLPKVASPPPPLPVSPPPTLLSTGPASYSLRDSEVEVEVGVAELMDSCTSEMVLIHNARRNNAAEQMLNGSLIVREDSAVTVNSRDVTPVLHDSSREATPCVDIAGDVTPVQEEEVDIEQPDLNPASRYLSEESLHSGPATSVPDSSIEKLEVTDSLESTFQSQASQPENISETESGTLSKTDLSTSGNRLGADSFQEEDAQSLQTSLEIATSLVNTYTVDQSDRDLNNSYRDEVDDADVHRDDVENIVHTEESLNYSKYIVAIDKDNDSVVSETTTDENYDVDEDVRKLERKYQELDDIEESDEENENDSDDDNIDEEILPGNKKFDVDKDYESDDNTDNTENDDVDDDDEKNREENEEIESEAEKDQDIENAIRIENEDEIEESVSDKSWVKDSTSPIPELQSLRPGVGI